MHPAARPQDQARSQTNYHYQNASVKKKPQPPQTSQQSKVQDQMALQVNSMKNLETVLKLFQNIAEEEKLSELMLQGQQHTETKTRERFHKTRKL